MSYSRRRRRASLPFGKSLILFSILAASLAGAIPLAAQDNPLWLRYPAISPDGQTILFCYHGRYF